MSTSSLRQKCTIGSTVLEFVQHERLAGVPIAMGRLHIWHLPGSFAEPIQLPATRRQRSAHAAPDTFSLMEADGQRHGERILRDHIRQAPR